MAWAPAMASVFGSILASEGQKNTNDTNLQIQENNSAFNAAEAAKNREFQAQQSNTVWQRAVADMQTAGLNPMLAYSQGGNPAAAGSMASAGSPGNAQNPYAAAGQSALQWAQLERVQAETENVEADTANKRDQNPNIKLQGPLTEQQTKLILNQTREMLERTYKTYWETTRIEKEVARVLAETKNLDARTATEKVRKILMDEEVPGAQNVGEHQRKYKGWNVDVKPFINDAASITNSAGNAVKAFNPASKQFNIRNYSR